MDASPQPLRSVKYKRRMEYEGRKANCTKHSLPSQAVGHVRIPAAAGTQQV